MTTKKLETGFRRFWGLCFGGFRKFLTLDSAFIVPMVSVKSSLIFYGHRTLSSRTPGISQLPALGIKALCRLPNSSLQLG